MTNYYDIPAGINLLSLAALTVQQFKTNNAPY